MSKPIAKSLLIHNAELQSRAESAVYTSEDTFTKTADLINVRVEPCSKYVATINDRQITISALLFFDCNNSLPSNQTFTAGQRIICNDITYTIAAVNALYDRRKLHHYELELST